MAVTVNVIFETLSMSVKSLNRSSFVRVFPYRTVSQSRGICEVGLDSTLSRIVGNFILDF